MSEVNPVIIRRSAVFALAALTAAALFYYHAYRRPNSPAYRRQVGPETAQKMEYILNSTNSALMHGQNDPKNERWLDISGNIYSTDFIRNFSYTNHPPEVRVTVDKKAPSFRGRIEASGLKPNFAYQIKLMGNYSRCPETFETIGYLGRWRLPGTGTNYTDSDYQSWPDKSQVRSYILFDYLVTDSKGNAVKDFDMDSSLHVLFNASCQWGGGHHDSAHRIYRITPHNPDIYAVPSERSRIERIWAESEKNPGRPAIKELKLTPGTYSAELVLTEESFHSTGNGGYWATVLCLPVEFEIQ